MKIPVIKMRKIRLDVNCTEKEVKQYGGVKNIKELLFDILNRYANSEYFDPDLVEEFINAKA